jgi:hypothetical protein
MIGPASGQQVICSFKCGLKIKSAQGARCPPPLASDPRRGVGAEDVQVCSREPAGLGAMDILRPPRSGPCASRTRGFKTLLRGKADDAVLSCMCTADSHQACADSDTVPTSVLGRHRLHVVPNHRSAALTHWHMFTHASSNGPEQEGDRLH